MAVVNNFNHAKQLDWLVDMPKEEVGFAKQDVFEEGVTTRHVVTVTWCLFCYCQFVLLCRSWSPAGIYLKRTTVRWSAKIKTFSGFSHRLPHNTVLLSPGLTVAESTVKKALVYELGVAGMQPDSTAPLASSHASAQATNCKGAEPLCEGEDPLRLNPKQTDPNPRSLALLGSGGLHKPQEYW